jgi:DNA-binding transcriptional LysR family regulator
MVTFWEELMTLYQFKIFDLIAKYGSLTKAAFDLRISQPALTHQMKQLRESYGATLYVKTLGGIVLTPAGERLLVGIGPILESVGKLRLHPTPARTRSREVLRIGGIESASVHLLPAVLARFRTRHPDVALEFRTRNSDHLERMVLSGSMDLAVTARRPAAADLNCEPLRRERVALFVPANHRLAKRKKLQLRDVVEEPLIMRGGRITDRAFQQMRDQVANLRIGMYCDGPAAIKAAVAQGMGVGMMFEEGLKAEVSMGRFKILEIHGLELEGESYIISTKSSPMDRWMEEFLQMVRDERDRLARSRSFRVNRRLSDRFSIGHLADQSL